MGRIPPEGKTGGDRGTWEKILKSLRGAPENKILE
jgi:hypothetical protein